MKPDGRKHERKGRAVRPFLPLRMLRREITVDASRLPRRVARVIRGRVRAA